MEKSQWERDEEMHALLRAELTELLSTYDKLKEVVVDKYQEVQNRRSRQSLELSPEHAYMISAPSGSGPTEPIVPDQTPMEPMSIADDAEDSQATRVEGRQRTAAVEEDATAEIQVEGARSRPTRTRRPTAASLEATRSSKRMRRTAPKPEPQVEAQPEAPVPRPSTPKKVGML